MSRNGASADTAAAGTDAERVHRRARGEQRGDVVLVEPAAHDDRHVGAPAGVEDAPHLAAEGPSSPLSSRTPANRCPAAASSRADLDRRMRGRHRIVGVEQQHRAVRERAGVRRNASISRGNAITKECAIVPESRSPYVRPARTLLVESNPVSSAARAAFIPASIP